MGTSTAFLDELAAQRATAARELRAAQAEGDDGAAAVALARLQDLDELLLRNGGVDVRSVEPAGCGQGCLTEAC